MVDSGPTDRLLELHLSATDRAMLEALAEAKHLSVSEVVSRLVQREYAGDLGNRVTRPPDKG